METLMTTRSVARTATQPLQHMSPGFEARRVAADTVGADLSPFVSLDWFVMSEPTFAPHPHAGFSAVTYLFEHSPGGFTNRWSLGDTQLIHPGSLHWTQAGSGMVHEEVPIERGVAAHGLQIFVKLPAALELSPPQAFHLDVGEFAEHRADGVRVKVLAGEAFGVRSPIEIANTLTMLDVHLDAEATLTLPLGPDDNATAIVVSGGVAAGEHVATEGDTIAWRRDGDRIELTARAAATVVVVAGAPLDEPIVAHGPFMMSTHERIHDAVARYQSGAMGTLAASF
jgi:redox-sensitive bicupin YhaK (pirin superfamily)